jgi:hypothetical protein
VKRLIAPLLVVPCVLLFLSASTLAYSQDDPMITDLIAGRYIDVGDILVWNDEEQLYVQYQTTDGWCLTVTHLHVATSVADIPQTKTGNPKPGQFAYSAEHDCLTEYTYEVPLQWDMNTELHIAAHAVVRKRGGKAETAWGAGEGFAGRNWATYWNYVVQGTRVIDWPDGGTVTVGFEDLPLGDKNDYDYNDWLASIHTHATLWGAEGVYGLRQIDLQIRPQARGAGYHHAFHLLIPSGTFGSDGHYVLTILDGQGNVLEEKTGVFDASIPNHFEVISSTMVALPGRLTNTIEPPGIVSHYPANDPQHQDYVPPKRAATLSIAFDLPAPFDFTAFDPYDPENMHGEGLFFDPYLHVHDTGEDIHRGDPRMLTVPVDWMWPEAGIGIWRAYPDVIVGDPPAFVEKWWLDHNDLVYDGRP